MKKFLLLVVLMFIPAILAACGGDSDEASGEAEETEIIGEDIEGATELTYWTFVGQHVDLFRDSAERWNEENPDRPIKLGTRHIRY